MRLIGPFWEYTLEGEAAHSDANRLAPVISAVVVAKKTIESGVRGVVPGRRSRLRAKHPRLALPREGDRAQGDARPLPARQRGRHVGVDRRQVADELALLAP
eukprot:731472-Prorocentrum_minimum.AAC.1